MRCHLPIRGSCSSRCASIPNANDGNCATTPRACRTSLARMHCLGDGNGMAMPVGPNVQAGELARGSHDCCFRHPLGCVTPYRQRSGFPEGIPAWRSERAGVRTVLRATQSGGHRLIESDACESQVEIFSGICDLNHAARLAIGDNKVRCGGFAVKTEQVPKGGGKFEAQIGCYPLVRNSIIRHRVSGTTR